MKRGDHIYLKPGASSYLGPGEVRGFVEWGVIVHRLNGTAWIWPYQWIA